VQLDKDKIVSYLIERGREPSTWRGVALILSAVGASLSEKHAEALLIAGVLLSGAIGAGVPDKK
jgi:hypothetical protein